MISGYAKVRRGIIEHLEHGWITPEEFAVYIFMILKADHRSGEWRGCGLAIADKFRWCKRKGQQVLTALFIKGYATSFRIGGRRGNYRIRINKYFQPAHPDAPLSKSSASRCATKPKAAHPGAPYQEVTQEELLQEEIPASPHLSRRLKGKEGKELVLEHIAEHFDHRKELRDRRGVDQQRLRLLREQARQVRSVRPN